MPPKKLGAGSQRYILKGLSLEPLVYSFNKHGARQSSGVNSLVGR